MRVSAVCQWTTPCPPRLDLEGGVVIGLVSLHDAPAFLLTVNEGRPDERVEAVRPMETEGRKTHVAFAQGLAIGAKWVYSDQITAQPK